MKNRPLVLATLLAGCAMSPPPPATVDSAIEREMSKMGERKPAAAPAQVEQALLPPLRMEMPQATGAPIDSRFDLSVSNAPASQVFNSLASGTRYSMLVHPGVSGTITLNLKDVTLREALESIRDLYGFEYRIDGTRILVQPAGIQTRVFQVNYLSAQRRGMTQLKVTSNSQSDLNLANNNLGSQGSVGGGGVGSGAGGMGIGGTGAGSQGQNDREATRIVTTQDATFWSDVCEALVALAFPDVAAAPGVGASAQQRPEDRQRAICNRRHGASDRSVVVSPHSGVIVVRATAAELRSVENYLRATKLAVERQVMLEAKIIEVTLSEQFQSGINWAVFNSQVTAGQISRLPVFDPSSGRIAGQAPAFPAGSVLAGQTALVGGTGQVGAAFGLAVATSNFSAAITFLETQGNVQVLSSPRVATLNNQKAVLKVGQEQLFVSNVQVTPATSTVAGVTPATIAPTFTPYFSGIVLDVTPQIDDTGNITLHVHPSINDVSQATITVPLGQGSTAADVPTARSTVRETDTIVRVADGNIVAIGGLMRTDVVDIRGGIPGVPDGGLLGFLFRSTTRILEKKELVILLKPTIISSDQDWQQDLRETRSRLDALSGQMRERDARRLFLDEQEKKP